MDWRKSFHFICFSRLSVEEFQPLLWIGHWQLATVVVLVPSLGVVLSH